jgi:hypothetical protein
MALARPRGKGDPTGKAGGLFLGLAVAGGLAGSVIWAVQPERPW